MKWKWVHTLVLLVALVATKSYASFSNDHLDLVAPIQQISVTNMLWNNNAVDGVPGMTPTTVTVAFYNGGSQPCATTRLAFQGFINLQVGVGQLCVAAVKTIIIAPVIGPAGMVYADPSAASLDNTYFTNQFTIENDAAPIFDTTNGAVETKGTIHISYRGQ